MKRRKRHKPRNVNLEPASVRVVNELGEEETKIIYAGDSLYTVPCPKSTRKRMRCNLHDVAKRSQVISPISQHTARELIVELGLKRNM